MQTVLNERNGDDFVKKVLIEVDSFALFIESALLDRSTSQKGKEACLDNSTHELVLRIYEKLADSLKDPAAQEHARELQNEYILVGATLFDLAAAYGKMQPDRVRTLLLDLCNYAPWLLSEIEASSDLLVDQISQFRSRLEECSQVRSVEEDSAQLIETMCTDLELQKSISADWLALAVFCKPAVGALLQDNRFIVELAKTWDVVSKQTINVKTMGLDLTRDQAPDMGHHAAFLDILNTTETLDAPLVPFVNSPFLLDIEFRFGLRQILEEAATIDKPQLDYLVMSIDQLVDMAEPLYRSGFHYLNERINTMQAVDLDGSSDKSGSRRSRDSTAGDKGDNQGNQMAIVQIRELFPGLGAGFICACLDHYGQNVETVIGAILEDSLPSDLADMDRTTETWAPLREYSTSDDSGSEYASASEVFSDVHPETSVLESRRNIFDNDEFDIFNRDSLDWSRVSKGKARKPSDNSTPGNQLKSRIMEIAQRMDEEDEYDDTYDETAQDGAVDTLDVDDLMALNAQEKAERSKRKDGASARETPVDPILPWEEVLVQQYMSSPDVLERNKASRNMPERQALRTKTGLSDEQLEGWYIMFQRNPRQKNVLISKYGFPGNQNRISTAPSDSGHPPLLSRHHNGKGKNTNDKDSSGQQTTNPTTSTPNYKKKNRNKAKIANHNRKQQHDRKTRQTMSGFGGQSL
ncbi:hypothetical protein GGI22_003442 [Coemansia erecta]|nr:hypothetical protein GGI22_003442 [Coemansia erecta]